MSAPHPRIRAPLVAACASLLLAACASSKPIHLYTLSSAASAQVVAGAKPYAIVLDPVSVPRNADIPQLVIADADGRSRLTEDHRWRAPLPDEIGAALAQQLQDQFGIHDLSRVSSPESLKLLRVRVDVQRFESLPGGQVLVAAAWSLRAADAKSAAMTCVTQLQQPAGADYAALVAAYRTAVAGLATQIGRGLDSLSRTPTASACPTAGA